MRLKRVKMAGFKTFAEKAEFDVHGDLIAVVGPNGCGKSNLVDAILWGLGEAASKQLRVEKGQDVIFNGSAKRKPVGYCEVTLLFDNEDGALPISTNEVAITRKLTRGGENEYFINRQSCRLRDVLDLLADTGLGRSGYAIVGQKEIDSALAASAEDRRAWVDEAAGVQRYRQKKLEALRRMAAAQAHLDRVNDVLREIEHQREPLREEAEVAKRYRQLQSSLREVESGLLMIEVAQATREVAKQQIAGQEAMQMIEKENRRADELDAKARLIGDAIAELEGQMDAVRARQQTALTNLERAEAGIQLCEQKLKGLDDLERSLVEDREHAGDRKSEAQTELELAQEELRIETENQARVRLECAGAGDEAKAIRAELTELESRLGEARESQALRLKLQAEAAHRRDRLKEIGRELDGLERDLPEVRRAAEEAQAEDADLKSRADDAKTQIQAAESQLHEMRAATDQEAARLREHLSERSALEGRRQGLEATLEAHEGVHQGPKAVLDLVKSGQLKGTYIPVGEAIEVDRKFATAIETSLGGSTSDLIVESDGAAKAAIALLKERRLGRATFQPIPLMRPVHVTQDLKDLLKRPGVVGRASELVRCHPSHRPVIDSLLGRIVIVENLDFALTMAKTSGWQRLVTLDGEVVHHAGSVTGGQAAKGGFGLVQRKAELAEIIKRLEGIEQEVEEVSAHKAQREAEESTIKEQLEALRGELSEAEESWRERSEWARALQAELDDAERQFKRLTTEREHLTGQEASMPDAVDVAAMELERDAVMRRLAHRSADADQAETRLRDADQRVEQGKIRLDHAQRRLVSAEEHDDQRQRRMEKLGPERDHVRQEAENLRVRREESLAEKQECERQLTATQGARQAKLEENLRIAEDARNARLNSQALNQAAHQAELARARAEAKRATAAERLYEEYGLTEEEAMAQADAINLPSDAAPLVSRLRREMKGMGDVNLGAIDAYERLTERSDELTGQRDDIEGSMAQLRETIKELDHLTRDRFVNTFEAVRDAFTGLFQRLFNGGEGCLNLNDPENVLESGIDIDVTLPGKKKQRLELLSGGERSLCASAFLFALLKVKPSPLVVLDEVDAPLDGRNVERFIELLKSFAGETQFIVITHNPTTISAAPVWLGVTMQEPGVSTLIPAKLPAEEVVRGVVSGESRESAGVGSPSAVLH